MEEFFTSYINLTYIKVSPKSFTSPKCRNLIYTWRNSLLSEMLLESDIRLNYNWKVNKPDPLFPLLFSFTFLSNQTKNIGTVSIVQKIISKKKIKKSSYSSLPSNGSVNALACEARIAKKNITSSSMRRLCPTSISFRIIVNNSLRFAVKEALLALSLVSEKDTRKEKETIWDQIF